jgi:hypothetical protein
LLILLSLFTSLIHIFNLYHFNLLIIHVFIIKFREIIDKYFFYIDIWLVRIPLYVHCLLKFLNWSYLFKLAISLRNFSCSFKLRIWIRFTDFIKLTTFCIFNLAFYFWKPFIFQYLRIDFSDTKELAWIIIKSKQLRIPEIFQLSAIIMILLTAYIRPNLRIALLLVFKVIINSYKWISIFLKPHFYSIPVPYHL